MRRVFVAIALFVMVGSSAAAASSKDVSFSAGNGSSAANPIFVRAPNETEAEYDYIKQHFGDSSNSLLAPVRDEKRRLIIDVQSFTTKDGKKHTVYFARPFDTRDYLAKGWWDKGFDHDRYQEEVERILSRGFQRDVIVRTVHLPPFHPEWIAGIVQNSRGFRAFRLDASYGIYQALDERARGEGDTLSTIRGIYKQRELPDALTHRIIALWHRVLSDSRNYRKDPYFYTDSSHFIFSAASPSFRKTGSTTYLETGNKANALFEVSVTLYDYVSGKPGLNTVEKSVANAERTVSR